jgi:nucleotide-binding universal stress UspA family protein
MPEEDWHPRVIVVGTDGSEQAIRAAHVGASVARKSGAKLLLVTVVRPPEGWWGVVGSPPPADALAKALSDAQRQALDTTVASLDVDGLDWETIEEIGDPAASLAAVAERRDADILVVGRRGAGLMERLVIGSVADRVTRESPCPVLVVP